MKLNLDVFLIINTFTVEGGRELNGIHRDLREVNSFVVCSAVRHILAEAKGNPAPLQRYIYSLKDTPHETDRDCRIFFKKIFVKAKQFGVSETSRVMGPMQVANLARRIEDAALEGIWRDVCLALERVDCYKDFDRTLKAPAIRKCLKDNQELAARVPFLNLGNKGLSFLPPEILLFSGLQRLLLIGNQFEEFPLEICGLKALKELQFSHNKLRFLPADIKNLKELQILDLQKNQLEELPEEIGQLLALQNLYLFQNCLKVLPKELGNLNFLQNLEAKENLIESVPEEITRLVPQLKVAL